MKLFSTIFIFLSEIGMIVILQGCVMRLRPATHVIRDWSEIDDIFL